MNRIKAFATNFTISFILIMAGTLGIACSAVAAFHGIAQWELICSDRVWKNATDNISFYQGIIGRGFDRYADVPFQDSILLRTSIGNAYDFFLGLIAFGWILVFVSTMLLMLGITLFYRDKLKEYQKENKKCQQTQT